MKPNLKKKKTFPTEAKQQQTEFAVIFCLFVCFFCLKTMQVMLTTESCLSHQIDPFDAVSLPIY